MKLNSDVNSQTKSYAMMLRELSSQHYQHALSFDQYRDERRRLLNIIDTDYNDGLCDAYENQVSESSNALLLGETMTFSSEAVVSGVENAADTALADKTEHT